MEIAAVNKRNHIHAAVDIDWPVSQIDCLGGWHDVNHYPVIVNCHH
jgi:hypothetical protein